MRVLIFSSMAHDLDAGSPIRGRMIRKGLQQLGATVAVCSCSSMSFPVSDYDFYNFADYNTLNEALDVAIESFRPDIVLSITIGLLDIVAHKSKSHCIPFVVDIHGLRSLELISEKMRFIDRFRSLRSAIRWEHALWNAAHVISANPMLGQWLKSISIDVTTVAGIVDDSFFYINPAIYNDDFIHFLYSGNFSSYQGIDMLLEAIIRLPQHFFDSASFTLQGTFFGNINDNYFYSKAKDLQRIIEVNPVPFGDFPQFLSRFHVSLVPRPWSLATYLAFPQKLVEGLSSGRYVIASDIAPHRFAIQDGVNGKLFSGGVNGLIGAIISARDIFRTNNISSVAQEMAHSYSLKFQCQKIFNILSQCIHKNKLRKS